MSGRCKRRSGTSRGQGSPLPLSVPLSPDAGPGSDALPLIDSVGASEASG
jgi:hypothetical protein